MKKKKRNQVNQPEPATPNLPAEPDGEVELVALDAEPEMEEAASFSPPEVESVMELAPDLVPELVADELAMDDLDPSSLEPMDELFNEMLAHEIDLAAAAPVPDQMISETLIEASEAPQAPPAEIVEPEEALLLQALTDNASDLLDQPDVLAALERATAPDVSEPETMVEFSAPEEASASVSAPIETPDDNISALLDAMPVSEPVAEPAVELEAVPETPPEPLAPQPALEAVVGSIDRALEAAPAVVSPVESSTQHHHQKQFSQLDDYVVFSLAGADYAVPVRDVAEIGRVPAITRVPNVPEFVRGITNLRGEVVPVLNLPALLGLMESQVTARGRVLFLQARAEVSATGLLVDEVKGIQRIQSQQLEQVTGLVDDKVTSVLRGVYGRGDRLLNVLDLEQLFQLQEFRQLETV